MNFPKDKDGNRISIGDRVVSSICENEREVVDIDNDAEIITLKSDLLTFRMDFDRLSYWKRME